jgi:hypothetical protein
MLAKLTKSTFSGILFVVIVVFVRIVIGPLCRVDCVYRRPESFAFRCSHTLSASGGAPRTVAMTA